MHNPILPPSVQLIVDLARSWRHRHERWVRITVTGMPNPDQIVVRGNLAKEVASPYPHEPPLLLYPLNRTSKLVSIDGSRAQVRVPKAWTEPVQGTPSVVELDESRALSARRAELVQAELGWRGLVQIGDRVMPERKARHDLEVLLQRADAVPDSSWSDAPHWGERKRIVKLVRALSIHPQGGALKKLLEETPGRPDVDAGRRWLARVREASRALPQPTEPRSR
jgi:hypothetical protein